MANTPFQGMGVALVTPFNEDKTIDFEALERLLEYNIDSGTDFLVVLGTTAETATLSLSERHEVVRFVVDKVDGEIPIIVGMGGNNTQALIDEIASFDFDGVHSILSVTPYYTKPEQEGLFQHFKAISGTSPLPIVLYNVPGRTGVNMTADTTIRIAKSCPNVIGIKEAHTDLEQVKNILAEAPSNFSVLSGDDPMTLDLIAAGGQGVISVLGNAFPKRFSSIVKLALSGNMEKANEEYGKLSACCDLFFLEGNPAGVKYALSLMGYLKNELRLPLVPVSGKTEMAIREELNRCM